MVLIKPLILWIEKSLEYQDNVDIFKNIWIVFVEIIPDNSEISLFDVAHPLLEKVVHHISYQSPTLSMLDFT